MLVFKLFVFHSTEKLSLLQQVLCSLFLFLLVVFKQLLKIESGKSVHYEVSSNYMNWLVGNDFIVALSFDNGGYLFLKSFFL